MQTQTKIYHCLTKIDTKHFSGAPKLPLLPKVGPSPKIKNFFIITSKR